MESQKPKVRIIIVNWNAGNLLSDCLRSINETRAERFQIEAIVVVDNASTDDSLAELPTSTHPLRILRNERNLGFARACNMGAEGDDVDYYLFLNPDTRLEPNTLHAAITFLEDTIGAKTGILGVRLVDCLGQTQPSCSAFPTPATMAMRVIGLDRILPSCFSGAFLDAKHHEKTRVVDQVMGAFFLVRHHLYTELRGFDERFFVYYEDLDFALRAKALGWDCTYLATGQAFHKGRGTTRNRSAEALYYNLRSRLAFCRKHYQPLHAYIITVLTYLIEPVLRMLYALITISPKRACDTVTAFTRLWRSLLRLEPAETR